MSKDSAAIVVAGGQGKRFSAASRQRGRRGDSVRKQYLTLFHHPILWWSVQAFQNSPSIGAIVLVVPAADLSRVRKQIASWSSRKPVMLAAGGKTRAESVRNGLAAVPPGFRWVAVHDAVRPLVTAALIEQVLKETRAHRAAIAAIPSRDSIKLATPGLSIQKSLPRHTVWLAQTPQAFDRRLLERAHGLNGKSLRRLPVRDSITDDAQLVERLGVRVKLVASSPDNLKVTLPMDLKIAEALLSKS